MSQIFGETRTSVSRTERSTAIAETRPATPVGGLILRTENSAWR
jgi:hypothetical protein